MSCLVDTNVVSELRKPDERVDPHVRAWATARRRDELYLSVISVLEIQVGIARLERRDPESAARLGAWFTERVLAAFDRRMLPVDLPVARRAAELHVPDPRPERDALIAATALVHSLVVVTRNVAGFAPMGVEVVDPWNP